MTASTTTTPTTGTRTRRAPLWALKLVMSVTGMIWAFFVLVHLFGNLKIYFGAAGFDHYAHWLREIGYPLIPHEGVLWALRITLIVALVAHVTAAVLLLRRSREARGGVRARRTGSQMWFATFMLPTGLILLAFLVLHVFDMTLGVQPAAPADFTAATDGGSPAANLVASLSRPWAAIAYAVAMLAAAAHVAHGALLAVNDLGATGATVRRVAVWVGALAAIAILLGNASIPVAVLTGVLS
ncbi:succinate dehydrogenase / fumarate reductase cytochrome b subunit [Kineosphaera limosa]|uniref:Succinate dehydrogenase cytochrome b subunit n=1 Tax=Kineosphaera limosa NBRC 100340 TaxID=1184609 RepID=K6WDN0_9MICO|nr:succinate dehydrogenase cytochrome b subunit [Kineosphaera limosa]NYE00651.1 succinate dehydrogenase / fumarate reductase cytochrome b subunit [Kineosphaera limosa]GAB97385.1 succinate dehydrogenase cytochrome b subunit [Kineosphaera limosa NBRC 100340]